MAARLRAGLSGVVLLLIGASLSACGGSQNDAVNDAAGDFYRAVARGDGRAACAALAPSTRSEVEQPSGRSCPVAILEEAPKGRGNSRGVEVFETMALVHWGRDTAFLTLMPDGWRVLAAGCTPDAGSRYDCAVKGG